MLVTFSCDAHENITMFGDVARRLLLMMGHSGSLPGAILSDDVPEALSRLQCAIDIEKQTPSPKMPVNALSSQDGEDEVSLVHRALPLISFLQDAVKADCNIMWKSS